MIPMYSRIDAASNSKPRNGRLSRLPLMPRKARMPGSIPAAHPAHPLMSAVITLRKPVEPWSARDACEMLCWRIVIVMPNEMLRRMTRV